MGSTTILASGGVAPTAHAFLQEELLGLTVFVWLILVAMMLFVMAYVIFMVRKRRRKALVENLRKQQMAFEVSKSSLFSERRPDDVKSPLAEVGTPKTIISEGMVAYTEAGDMLVFKSSEAADPDDVVAAAIKPKGESKSHLPPSWSPSYVIDRVIAMHITGVVMFTVDRAGNMEGEVDLDPDLLMVLERVLEEAKWLGGDMVMEPFHGLTLCLCWGGDLHLAALVEGEPDERLDRELRWAVGDLVDEFSDDIWSWTDDAAPGSAGRLGSRVAEVVNLTRDVDLVSEAARSKDGSVVVSSTVAWRRSLAEYRVGIHNKGPGSIHEVQLLPTLGEEGLVDVVTVLGVEVDKDVRFIIDEVPEGQKAVATFLFRPRHAMSVRVDSTVIYLRGVADVQEVKLPGRWLELEGVELSPGEQVEPERALELATQPAAFRDRCPLFMPAKVDPERLFSAGVKAIKEHMRPVVELEDEDRTQFEAWFHAELLGGGTAVASLTVMPREGILEVFAASTVAGVLPGALHVLRRSIERAARATLPEVLDPELATLVIREGSLLVDSWGEFED